MAIVEVRQGSPLPPVTTEGLFSPDKPPEKLYITPNRKGIDITTSPFPRVERVVAHERACLDFSSSDEELSRGARLLVGSNANNTFTAARLFERIRRPDIVVIDEHGIVRRIIEGKTSKGVKFHQEAQAKIDNCPRFLERGRDNSGLYVASLKVWFTQDGIGELIPWRIIFQDPSQTDFVFLTPYDENEDIVEKIGRGQFRSVGHRTVKIPELAAKAA